MTLHMLHMLQLGLSAIADLLVKTVIVGTQHPGIAIGECERTSGYVIGLADYVFRGGKTAQFAVYHYAVWLLLQPDVMRIQDDGTGNGQR